MNCNDAKIYLTLYCSGELDARSMVELEHHMDQCVACARELDLNKAFDGLLRGAFTESSPDTKLLLDRVNGQIQLERTKRSAARRFVPWATAAAVLVAVFAGLFFYLHRSHSNPIYQAAIHDHYEEIVRLEPRKTWRNSSEDIQALLRANLPDPEVSTRIVPAEYRLVRAKICDLDGRKFLHLVYQKDETRMSVFLAAKADNVRLATPESNTAQLHREARDGLGAVGFQTAGLTVLYVSDLPGDEATRIASDAESRLIIVV